MNHIIQKGDAKKWIFGACMGGALIALPFTIPEFWTYTFSVVLTYCIFALGYNIILGYGGMMAFGHAGFYGVGSYVVAILLTKTEVPYWVALILSPLLASFFGLIIGILSVRRRAFYFGILTMAFGQLIWSIIFKWYSLTGGENGITGIPLPSVLSTIKNMYFFALGVTVVCTYIIYRITNSPFGGILLATRENAQRVEFIGIKTDRQRLVAFVISAWFAGLAGGIYTLITRGAFPDLAHWAKSGEVLLFCMLGGMHTFFGPAVGAGIVFFVDTFVSSFTEHWPLILAALFLLVVLFLPEGVVGYIEKNLRSKFHPD